MIYVSSKLDKQSIDLGTLFMQNFVTSYDYKSGTVRFGVNVNAPEGTKMVTDSPTPDPDAGKKPRIGLLIALLILLVVGFVVGLWYLYDRRRAR